MLAAALVLLAGCASTLRSEVTSFQRWPANTAGASYSFARTAAQNNNLEHASYEDSARAQLALLGLKEAVAGAPARFSISLQYGTAAQTQQTREPLWQDQPTWQPIGYYHPTLGWQAGYWKTDPFGPRVVGYQTVERSVQRHRLRVDMSEGGSKVFEATATTVVTRAALSQTLPYLMRSVFEGFPGSNGQSRALEWKLP
jgi:hypothetical protein